MCEIDEQSKTKGKEKRKKNYVMSVESVYRQKPTFMLLINIYNIVA